MLSIALRLFYVALLAFFSCIQYVSLSFSLLTLTEGVIELWACDLAGCWMTVSLKSAGSSTPPQNQRKSPQPPKSQMPSSHSQQTPRGHIKTSKVCAVIRSLIFWFSSLFTKYTTLIALGVKLPQKQSVCSFSAWFSQQVASLDLWGTTSLT